jgi:hypothetical protein
MLLKSLKNSLLFNKAVRQKKNMCVYGHPTHPIFQPPVPESDSGIPFSKFPVSRHLFYDELHSFSTFFALNFNKMPLHFRLI